jgi:hypothetical protein
MDEGRKHVLLGDEGRKRVLLIAASILLARKLVQSMSEHECCDDLRSNRIWWAEQIPNEFDGRWPAKNGFHVFMSQDSRRRAGTTSFLNC